MSKARIGLPKIRPSYSLPGGGPTKPEPRRINLAMVGLIAVALVGMAWFAMDRLSGQHSSESQGTASAHGEKKHHHRHKAAPKPSSSPTSGGFLVG